MLELLDIGLNLTHDSFDDDRDEVVQRAASAGVTRFVITGATVASSAHALELAHRFPGRMFATAGVHPHHAESFDAHSLAALRGLVGDAQIVAVGECGLDYYRNFSSHAAQLAAFRGQLELAAECRKPVFLHQRDAHAAFCETLRPLRNSLVGGVAHCFTGNTAELEEYLAMGLYIGITGWVCDERRGGALREALPHIPVERLLLETDAPYLLPRDLPEKPANRRNEPCYLPHVLSRIAAITGHSEAVLAAASVANAERLFGLAPATGVSPPP